MSGSRVAYFYDDTVGNYYYGPQHPMKPHRIRLAHNLIVNYGMYEKMNVFRPSLASFEDMTRFHADEYLNFLKLVTPQTRNEFSRSLVKYNVGDDCPIFDGLYRYCQIYTGASIGGAVKLNEDNAQIAINWSGGLHHAKKAEASGFCYVNDCVVAILELLKRFPRVLYIDIDVHHGDGVEEAFYTTDRVMTCSFHKYGEFFPGTGDIKDLGANEGKFYSVNVPLNDGITDESYLSIFKPTIAAVMEHFDPGAVVLQCGADSLSGDRIGSFNLTLKGHGEAVNYVKSFGKHVLMIGGGGYTIRNVSRCWAYETAVMLGIQDDIPNEIPPNNYLGYYGPNFKLHIDASNMENKNTRSQLSRLRERVVENLRRVPPAPNAFGEQRPPAAFDSGEREQMLIDGADPDERIGQVVGDRAVTHAGELATGGVEPMDIDK